MCGYWSFIVLMTSVSVVMPEGLWGIDRGWHTYKGCRVLVKDGGLCRKLAEDMFRKQFPDLKLTWPACGKDDVAEAILWAAMADGDFVERYLRQFRSLCASGR